MKYIKKFERTMQSEVLSYIKRMIIHDKKEYKYKWSDRSWLIDEIHNFITMDIGTSYVLRQFFSKYRYEDLENILIDNYKSEFVYVLEEYMYTTLEEYLLKKDTEKYNL